MLTDIYTARLHCNIHGNRACETKNKRCVIPFASHLWFQVSYRAHVLRGRFYWQAISLTNTETALVSRKSNGAAFRSQVLKIRMALKVKL